MRSLTATVLFIFLCPPSQTTEKWLVEPKYDDIVSFREGLDAVKINGKHGYINCSIVTTGIKKSHKPQRPNN